MSVFLKICDFVFVLRPLILIPAWSMYLIGAFQGAAERGPLQTGIPSPSALLSLTGILVTAYLLNQIFDRESDEKNDKCLYLSRGIFRMRTLLVIATVSFLIASLAFQRVAAAQRGPLFLALVLSLFYSLPPLRLCARPFADMAANAVGYGGVAYVLGYATYEPALLDASLHAVPYVLLVASVFLHTAILDVAGDEAVGKTTTAVLIGERASTRLAGTLHGLAVACALFTGNHFALVVTGASLLVSLYPLLRRTGRSSPLIVQATTLIVTVAAILVWPAYGVVIVPLVLLARFYYRRRFGITYPGPKGTV